MLEKMKEAAGYIESRIKDKPQIGLILGSGLGVLGDDVKDAVYIEYNDIPHFPVSTVEGHSGRLVYGVLNDKKVLILQGRFHYYEGYPMHKVVFPVRVMKLLGMNNLIVTNAAGGINESFTPGDLMLIKDHIMIRGENPLRGENFNEFGPRFNDMSDAYCKTTRNMVKKLADKNAISLKEGVYIYMPGPSFETPAEIKLASLLGADAVGMSTAPEVITAAHCGMEVIGISCITNMAAGILDQPLNHQEVMETGELVRDKFLKLITEILGEWKIK